MERNIEMETSFQMFYFSQILRYFKDYESFLRQARVFFFFPFFVGQYEFYSETRPHLNKAYKLFPVLIKPLTAQITISCIWMLFLFNAFTFIVLPICPFRVMDNSLTIWLVFSLWCLRQSEWDRMRSSFIRLLTLYAGLHLVSSLEKFITYSIQRIRQKSLQVNSVGIAVIIFYQIL